MKLNFAKEYNRHSASYKKKYLEEFEEGLKHALKKQYFISIFQEKVKNAKSETYRISNLHSKISEFDNALDLDDRLTLIDIVTKFCKDEKRDLLQTLFYIAEIKSLDEIWTIAEKRRQLIKPINGTPGGKKSKTKINSLNLDYQTLQDIFIDGKSYNHIITLLVSHDFCSNNPLVWLPQKGANKQILSALLFLLMRKRYYKLKKYPSNELLIKIAKNTFSIPLSNSTLKIKDLSRHETLFGFIPDSSELK